MTEKHLKYIMMECGLSIDETTIKKLYSPEYKVHSMSYENFLNLNKKSLCFDWAYENLTFVSGSVSCTGVKIVFRNDYFYEISVYPLYDFKTGKIYNSVLATPKFTDNDFLGRKSIKQTAHIIRNEKDLHRYFKKLFEKFECPLISYC